MKKTVAISLLVLGLGATHAQQVKDSIKKETAIDEVELFGERNKQPEGLEVITRLPLKTRDQIQSISVVSNKVIEELGGLTVTDVAKNIPGVTQFGSYGGTRESMSIRGYRGVPVLKNELKGDTFACLNDKDKKIVVMYDNQEIKSQAITEIIKNKLRINPQYVRTEYIESFPLSQNGKINYPLLQNLQHENS